VSAPVVKDDVGLAAVIAVCWDECRHARRVAHRLHAVGVKPAGSLPLRERHARTAHGIKISPGPRGAVVIGITVPRCCGARGGNVIGYGLIAAPGLPRDNRVAGECYSAPGVTLKLGGASS